RAPAFARAAGRSAVRRGRGARPIPPLPGPALPLGRARGRRARLRLRGAGVMRIGIVGMPNAGKSSLFNALTKAGAEAANYPFTTIEPNVAVVPVRDERLDRIAEVVGSSEVVYDTIDFHDIAGLVAGAHKGEGLGNRFLANVAEGDDAVPGPIAAHAAAQGAAAVAVSSRLEAELAELDDGEAASMRGELGVAESGLDRVVHGAFALLHLLAFFTAGEA